MVIHLEIKAVDVPRYHLAEVCPITKALRKAGYNWKDTGVHIWNEDNPGGKVIGMESESYTGLVKKVVGMFHTYMLEHGKHPAPESLKLQPPIPIEDFEYDLVVEPLN